MVGATAWLSEEDVQRLLVDRSPEARIETIGKVMGDYEAGRFGPREQEIVRQIVRRLAIDAEKAVREAVAWQIAHTPLLSKDLAERLAQDLAEIAFPVLRHASFDEDFLLAVVRGRDGRKQLAVAARDDVSPRVSDAIVESANVKAIERLVRNPGARIAEPTLHRAVDRFAAVEGVAEALAGREGLPIAVVERLVHYVAEEIRDELLARHDLPPDVLGPILDRGRDAASTLLLEPIAAGVADVEAFARQLHAKGRLGTAFLFRALCCGDFDLFVACVATRCGVPVDNARIVLLDPGQLGLKAVFERAKLPPAAMPAFRAALSAMREGSYAGGDKGRAEFQSKVIARVHNACGASQDPVVEDLLLHLGDAHDHGQG
jgi:uncharacterized protein (DUF2336 family)